ncbi:MAG TPA: 2-dehydropantoate 2-reductase N-terminal domain-containing protein [Solirubrobacteraceae bacterium]|nr:2-dehydropantoate 2-reductase N-terminal domain-containing protein [Solirubrobacteraceae bacterium]
MRFVVYGAGAVGGVVGARLHQAGHEVILLARGAHYEAIVRHGLRLETPEESAVLEIAVYDRPAAVPWRDDDVVLLAVKTQDTAGALGELVAVAPAEVPIVCVQNGVENERLALRTFPNVYGALVMAPTAHLEPGVVQAYSTPLSGGIDIGRYPRGADSTCELVAAALSGARFSSLARAAIMRWKYAKLLLNLGNVVEALCGADVDDDELDSLARDEGRACLRAAGIDFAGEDEDAERRNGLLRLGEIAGRERGGGSTWQSFTRGARSIETDYLNGEIVLLGRLHGVPTPVNTLLCELARRAMRADPRPGALAPADILARLR